MSDDDAVSKMFSAKFSIVLRYCGTQGEAVVVVSTSGVVPEQTKQGEAIETADINGARTLLR
jgi:hypothetical protein